MTPLYIVYHFPPHGCYSARNANHGTRRSHAPCHTTVTRSFTNHCTITSQQQLFTLENKPCLHQKEALFVSKTSLVYNQKKPCLKTDDFPFVFSIHFHGKRVYLKKNFKLICIYRTLCVPLHRFYRATGCSAVG